MKFNYIFLYLLLAVLSFRCTDDDPEELPPTPSNLQLEVKQDAPGSKSISLQLSSENTSFYKIYFGEGANEAVITEENTISHTYANPGTYTIRVQAHSSGIIYISETQQVTIGNMDEGEEDIDIPATGYSSPESYEGMSLVWRDEFDGETLNLSDWTFETGTGANGWGNNELQYYREENTLVEGGHLIITAKKEAFGGQDYTSSRIITQNKQSFQYGRIDIRAVLPQGQGIWPALWMLGSDFSTTGWPACGEIDIVELVGGAGKNNTIHGTVHWEDEDNHAQYSGAYSLEEGIFADEFHVFSIVWNANTITWLIDDEEFHVVDITPAELSEFHQEFFLIFNIAVGGNWPGNPDAGTPFPQRMIVDYVRVFQQGSSE